MIARPTAEDSADIKANGGICCAPSCWSAGSPVEIDERDVSRTPVLCKLHRKSYLGVST